MKAPVRTMRRCSRRFFVTRLTLVLLACMWAPRLHAEDSEPRVELECKIVASSPQARYKAWVLQVRKADGQPLRQVLKGTGDTIRLKDIQPGIYTLCLIGGEGRERCESIDLTPPKNRNYVKFTKKLKTPEAAANRRGAHRVSVSNLLIPKAARTEFSRSEEAERRGDIRETIRLLESAVTIFPDYPAALNNLGVHYYRGRDYSRSIGCLSKATSIDPDFYAAWANLGTSFLAVGKFDEALPASKQAHVLKPDDPRIVFQVGLTYYYLHEYSEAKEYFEKSMLLDPEAASSPQLFLAQIAIIQKQEAEAERYIDEYLRLHPNTPQAARLKNVQSEVRMRHVTTLPSLDPFAGP